LIHPIELDKEKRNAWGTVLNDYEIIQPFAQMGRPVHEPKELEGTSLAPSAQFKIPLGPLHGVLNRLGYMKGPQSQTDYMRVKSPAMTTAIRR